MKEKICGKWLQLKKEYCLQGNYMVQIIAFEEDTENAKMLLKDFMEELEQFPDIEILQAEAYAVLLLRNQVKKYFRGVLEKEKREK